MNVLEIIYFGLNVGLNVFFLCMLILVQYAFHRSRFSNDPIQCVILQLVVPFGILAVYQIFLLNILLLLFALLTIAGLYLFYNHTDWWFRQKFDYIGEKLLVLSFKNQEDQDDRVNVFKARFNKNVNMRTLLEHNLDLLEDLSGNSFIETLGAGAKDAKRVALQKLDKIFGEWHMHIIYCRFYSTVISENVDLNSLLQIYLLSTNAELPRSLLLSCALLEPEKVEGRDFSTIFAIEGGMRNELVLSKIANLANDLEVFKIFPKFWEIDALIKRSEYFEAKSYDVLDEFERLSKHELTINTKIESAFPARRGKNKRGRNDYE